jgi:hypothetical protein
MQTFCSAVYNIRLPILNIHFVSVAVPFIYFQLNYFQARFTIIGEHLALSVDTLVVFIK